MLRCRDQEFGIPPARRDDHNNPGLHFIATEDHPRNSRGETRDGAATWRWTLITDNTEPGEARTESISALET